LEKLRVDKSREIDEIKNEKIALEEIIRRQEILKAHLERGKYSIYKKTKTPSKERRNSRVIIVVEDQ
jgi:hypothetical protein